MSELISRLTIVSGRSPRPGAVHRRRIASSTVYLRCLPVVIANASLACILLEVSVGRFPAAQIYGSFYFWSPTEEASRWSCTLGTSSRNARILGIPPRTAVTPIHRIIAIPFSLSARTEEAFNFIDAILAVFGGGPHLNLSKFGMHDR